MAQWSLAQIVNIEDQRKLDPQDTIAWFGQVGLQYSIVQNGDQVSQTKFNARFDRVYNRHLVFSITNYNLVNIGSEKFINDGFQHLRYNYRMSKRWTYEAFAQAQYNERLNLRLRTLLGTGPRYAWLTKENYNGFIGVLYMYEYSDESAPDREFHDHRMSSYLSFELHPKPYLTIGSTNYFQPLLTDFGDFRVSSQTRVNFNITSKLFFTTTFNFTYDTDVPEGIVNTIYSLTNGIRFMF
ncbi:MAG: DUF481 domain-containing protein [Saprospiraceae bacterium]